jgi:hypothetical protein
MFVGRTPDVCGLLQLPNFLGEVSDLRANLRRLGMAASLTPEEWTEYRQMVETRLGLRL